MAGAWSYKVDGVELNDGVIYATQIPELEDSSDLVIIVTRDRRPPAFIRSQDTEAIYTLKIDVLHAPDWPTWSSRMADLNALLGNGPHTLSVQARGMPTPVSTNVIITGKIAIANERRIDVPCVVPAPLF